MESKLGPHTTTEGLSESRRESLSLRAGSLLESQAQPRQQAAKPRKSGRPLLRGSALRFRGSAARAWDPKREPARRLRKCQCSLVVVSKIGPFT